MEDPVVGGERAAMLYAGDDDDASATVHTLAKDLGFDPHHVGGLKCSRYLEGVAMTWIHMSLARGRGFAFVLKAK